MTKFTGIDISKQSFDCSITLENGKIESRKFSNDLEGFSKLKKLLCSESHVVMEASGPYYLRLATFLHQEGIKVSVVNALIIRRFCQMRMMRTKTDKKDAIMIREYAKLENPGLWKPDEPLILKLKNLNTMVELLDKGITATNNQLEAFKTMPGTDESVIAQLESILEFNEQSKQEIELQMEEIVKENFSNTYKSLLSIPGIGKKTAALLIAITGNFKKFDHYKQLIAYVGLNPRVFESGTSVKGRGHICKMGTSRLRKTIYLCTWSAKKSNPQCIEMYKRLKEKSKPNKVINVALANKLLRQAFAMGKYEREYEKNYQKIFAN